MSVWIKDHSFVINVIVFSHRSDTYVHVLLFIELHSIPPRYLFILFF